ncbi:nucleosidase [Nocardioides sp. AE5]|uniref:nucleosidase n=1 Tax=Nocardioides sp. AE5 TaxID=2962573 RepID=UPI0028828FAD|nr:nucleosidase [Nocardioides sp. AE5]MDT0203584.1 nucleosidase [Nocardioides sp. AE5]
MAPLLIVAATRAEAAYVPDGVDVVITGIGKVPAAVATTRALAARNDLADLVLVNLGTAGALRNGLEGLFEPGVVVNHDINADAIRALDHDPQERLVVGPGDVVLASGDLFVTDPAERVRLAQTAHLVDMEAYAVAWAARQFGVGTRLVKHVSDNADEGAMEWLDLVDASARVLGAWVEEFLAGR